MNLRYLFGALFTIPLLPVMYYQGRRIRAIVPELPEAEGIEGKCPSGTKMERTLNVITIGESIIAGVGVKIQ